MTAALEGGEWSAARPGRTLLPGKTRYSFYRRLVGPQGRSGRAENLVPTGILSRTVQPVVRQSYPAYNRKEYHEYFLDVVVVVGGGEEGGRCVGLTTYHLHVPTVLKLWSLKLLEPSGPVQACNGIALAFTLDKTSQLVQELCYVELYVSFQFNKQTYNVMA